MGSVIEIPLLEGRAGRADMVSNGAVSVGVEALPLPRQESFFSTNVS